MRLYRVLAVALMTALSAISSVHAGLAYVDPLYGVSVTSNVVYGSGATTSGSIPLLMDVYQPTDIGNGKVLPNRPAVVIQDGGAWTSGSKTNGRVVTPAMYLAQRGYTVFITDYRQVGDSPVAGPGPWQNLNFSSNGSFGGLEVTIYPSQNVIRAGIQDYATAVSFVRANAATYGIDPNRIGLAGGSAGAVNAMDLEYNNPAASYKAQAVVALVGTMYGDWDKVQAGGPPLYLWNNVLDPLILYTSDVGPNLHNQLLSKGIYYEQWFEDPNLTDHNVHYEQHPLADTSDPYLAGKYGDQSEDALQRIGDFLAAKLAGGPVVVNAPEPSSLMLGLLAAAGLTVGALRRRFVGSSRRRT